MSSDLLLSLQNVSKRYELYSSPRHRLMQMLFRGRRIFFNEFWALRDVSFKLHRGQSMAILGRNGAGKSTLLQIIAGVLTPTTGSVQVNGRVAALLELGSGFNPEFSGRENAYMNGAILGLSNEEMTVAMTEIERFAGVGDFFDQPVKLYSSGMLVRVAFAVQVQLKPDILIVDEALAVGDAVFQKRCYQRIRELLERGTSLLFVTHDIEAVRSFTQFGLLLEHGQPLAYGPSAEVLTQYRQLLLHEEKAYLRQVTRQEYAAEKQRTASVSGGEQTSDAEMCSTPQAAGKEGIKDFGDKEAWITSVVVQNHKGEEENVFFPGEVIRIGITFRTKRDMNNLYVGVRIRNKEGVKVYSWGTFNQDMTLRSQGKADFQFWEQDFEAEKDHTVWLECPCCNLGPNFYEVEAHVVQQTALNFQSQVILHWLNEAAFFYVKIDIPAYAFGGTTDMQMRAFLQNPIGK